MKDPEDVLARLGAPFAFESLPSPISGSLRPLRRVVLVLMLVGKAHGATTNWKGLHVLNWAIRSDSSMAAYLAFGHRSGPPDRPIVRFDPALERVVDLAVGLNLLEYTSSGAIHLTQAGRDVLSTIAQADVLREERLRLDAIPGRVTRSHVDELLDWRTS